ncbi:TRAP transporter small permease subunit [Pseudooceanicola sediminis]|uniref:TRAP transporter small permease protein n=1 Tax=Pseudooceanicola sediminis TaxID=2211117 RepID=A0A399J521_9RHOB|nr:TRAP transporter small permease subunit [Pseudooceanicola sediminis]KAA2317106.1 TRAP transporter small permease subunit [Puniceibacterium sp. HSS470]RII40548.1 TRAP transporter small permease subunit [Pseudooceanicola sediminis]|tara:strand:+ start:157025 stop:157519 length:495 start_codon:yes stop_codon:yes gene_type:complete
MIFLCRRITALNRLLFTAAKWLVYAIVLMMLWEVLSRYLLNSPTSWAPELATLTFGPYFLLGGPYLLHLGGHVAVDVISEKATGGFAVALKFVGLALAAVTGAILLWFSLPLVWQSFSYGETSYSAFNPVIWPAKAFLPLAALLLLLQALADVGLTVSSRKEGA